MTKVFRIAAILVALYLLEKYAGVKGTLITLLYLLTFLYAGYLIVKAFSVQRSRPVQAFTPASPAPAQLNPPAVPKRRYTGLVIVVLLVVAVVFIKYLAIVSINFILFMNRLLRVPADTSPVALWALTGLFAGMIYGSLVAWRKYKLHPGLAIYPIAALAVFITVMFFLNEPLTTHSKLAGISENAFRFVNVRSSGYLPAYKLISYADSNLVDGNEKTTWIENAKNAGIGEWISFKFNKTPDIENYKNFKCAGLYIVNGYAKSGKLWASHNRLREFRVSLNGITVGNFIANDSFNQQQTIPIRPFAIRYNDVITVQINSVYYGTQNNKLTAISELVPVVEIKD